MMESNYEPKPVRIVITGGPGSGKTELIRHLSGLSYMTFPDVATNLIMNGLTPPVQHLDEKGAFGSRVLTSRIDQYRSAVPGKLNFYDRGIPDGLAFSLYLGKIPDISLQNSANIYTYDWVFILPPWEKIYCTNAYRKESFIDAERIYQCCLTVYNELYLQVLEIPPMDLEDRLAYLFSFLPSSV